jgi:hypothetical protein
MGLVQSTLIPCLDCLIRTCLTRYSELGLALGPKHFWFLGRTELILGHPYVFLCPDDFLTFFSEVGSLILDQYSAIRLCSQVSVPWPNPYDVVGNFHLALREDDMEYTMI